MNDIFEGIEERKEYVLHEAGDHTIVIRCVKSDGNWHRVRYPKEVSMVPTATTRGGAVRLPIRIGTPIPIALSAPIATQM